MLKNEQCKRILSVISDPAHGQEFYDKSMLENLLKKIESILTELDVNENTPRADAIKKINDYLKANVSIRDEYFIAQREIVTEFPTDELPYRTAYAALCKGQAMCAGFAEAARVLLECCNFNTHTLLSNLPGKNKVLLHYVTAIEYDEGSGRKYFIFDPEREASCDRKGYDFRNYLLNMTYIRPEEFFYKNKVGTNGLGPRADKYIERIKPRMVVGKNKVGEILDENERVGK